MANTTFDAIATNLVAGATAAAFQMPPGTLPEPTLTARVYDQAQTPLRSVSGKHRGTLLEALAKSVVCEQLGLDPEQACLPPPADAVACNGSCVGANSTPYDFGLIDPSTGALVRYEVKSAQLKWGIHHKYWKLNFQKIKPALHDRLVLVLYTPHACYVAVHTGGAGVSRAGRGEAANGHTIQFVGPRNEADPTAAVHAILARLAGHGVGVVQIQYDDPRFAVAVFQAEPTVTAAAYAGGRLAALSPKCRGQAYEATARAVDAWLGLNPTDATAVDGDGGAVVAHGGQRLGRNATPFDYWTTGTQGPPATAPRSRAAR